jgi:hypothetical protein
MASRHVFLSNIGFKSDSLKKKCHFQFIIDLRPLFDY